MIVKHYGVFLNNKLAYRFLTRKGAEAFAFRAIKNKEWDSKQIEVKELCQN